jgi:putative ABC transport system permease protein
VVVSATVLLVATGVAGATLVPVLHAGLGVWLPYIPSATLAAGVLLVVAVVVAGMVIPAAVLTRRPPVEVVRIAV